MDPLFILAGATVLAVLLASAGLHKLQDLAHFREVSRRYRLVPAVLIPAFALFIPLAEIAASLLLLVDATRLVGGILAVALLSLYAVAIGINLIRGRRDLDCGCSWGVDGRSGSNGLSSALVLRNVALVAMAGLVAASVPTRELLWLDYFNGTAAGVVLALICVAANRLLNNHQLIQLRRSS
ncbi:MAG: MauE/DoxX family redox-associated membrane protein [Panacagrimonas sp.]